MTAPEPERVLKVDTGGKIGDGMEPVWRWGDRVWGYKATLCNIALTNNRLILAKARDKAQEENPMGQLTLAFSA